MSEIWSFRVRAFLFLGLGGVALSKFSRYVWGGELGPGAVGDTQARSGRPAEVHIEKSRSPVFFFGKSKPPREPQLSIALLFRPREQALRAVLAHKLHRLPIAVARASAAEGLGRGYGVGFYKKAPTKTALKNKRLHIFT